MECCALCLFLFTMGYALNSVEASTAYSKLLMYELAFLVGLPAAYPLSAFPPVPPGRSPRSGQDKPGKRNFCLANPSDCLELLRDIQGRWHPRSPHRTGLSPPVANDEKTPGDCDGPGDDERVTGIDCRTAEITREESPVLSAASMRSVAEGANRGEKNIGVEDTKPKVSSDSGTAAAGIVPKTSEDGGNAAAEPKPPSPPTPARSTVNKQPEASPPKAAKPRGISVDSPAKVRDLLTGETYSKGCRRSRWVVDVLAGIRCIPELLGGT